MTVSTRWFAVVDGWLGVESVDQQFLGDFADMYRHGAVDGPGEGPQARCRISRSGSGRLQAQIISSHQDPDAIARAFGTLGAVPSSLDGIPAFTPARWQTPAVIRADGFEFSESEPWQWLVSWFAVQAVLAVQPHLLCFHAAAVAINGTGVVMMGPSGSGKTTLSLELARRGHLFLSDEVAALDRGTGMLRPFLRTALVVGGEPDTRKDRELPDNVARTTDALPVGQVLLLRGRAGSVRTESFVPSLRDMGYVTPLAPSSGGGHIMDILRFMGSVRCHHLFAGTPADTAAAIEALLET